MSAELSRRGFLTVTSLGALGLVGAGAFTSCSPPAQPPSYILATDPEVAEAEAARVASGKTVRHRLVAESGPVSVGSGSQRTWGYREDAALATLGPALRASRGDRLIVDVENQLPEVTSAHWHGLRIRNDMDGSPPDTQDPIATNSTFRYDFLLPDHGTYWYHSHTGLQADRALFGALVIEDPDDRSGTDIDLILVLDDWLPPETTPEEVLAALGAEGSTSHHHGDSQELPQASDTAEALVSQGMGESGLLGGYTQHIAYPVHLINGRSVDDPDRLTVAPGSRVRLRVINAAAETPYRVALAGHRVTIIASDGFDTQPHEADTLLIAPAQRIDLLVDLTSGAWPFVARVEGRPGAALAVLATSDATASTPSGEAATRIPELNQKVTTDADLHPSESSALADREPDQLWRLELIEVPENYIWGIAGDHAATMRPRTGERIRMEVTNNTSMWHPMHLHGHTFASRAHNGLRRDTEIVLPGETAVLDFDADNPGRWMIHCHNAYHFAAGMTAPIRYIR